MCKVVKHQVVVDITTLYHNARSTTKSRAGTDITATVVLYTLLDTVSLHCKSIFMIPESGRRYSRPKLRSLIPAIDLKVLGEVVDEGYETGMYDEPMDFIKDIRIRRIKTFKGYRHYLVYTVRKNKIKNIPPKGGILKWIKVIFPICLK